MSETSSESPSAMQTSDELVLMLNNHPQASRQISLHWLTAAIGLIPFVVVVVLVQLGLIQVFALPAEMDELMPVIIAVIAHSVVCLLALFMTFGSSRALRRDAGNDHDRIAQLVTYLVGRRRKILGMAWLGHVVVIMAGLYGLNFSMVPWLIIPLVPSFLLISLSIRQPPNTTRLAAHIRRMRMLHQTSAMDKVLK